MDYKQQNKHERMTVLRQLMRNIDVGRVLDRCSGEVVDSAVATLHLKVMWRARARLLCN